MGLEEICQLYIPDLKEISGIYYFDALEEEKPDKLIETREKRNCSTASFLGEVAELCRIRKQSAGAKRTNISRDQSGG
jgi:hypothetical protein